MTTEQQVASQSGKGRTGPYLLAFDLDDTLVDYFSRMCELVEARWPGSKPEEITNREMHIRLGIELQEWLDFMIETNMLETAMPRGKMDIIQYLMGGGDRIIFITNRGFHPNAHALTVEWLQKHVGIEDPEVHVLKGIHESKAQYLQKHFGCVDYFFDDVPEHCLEALEIGATKRAVLMDMPWNRDIPSHHSIRVIRMNSVDQFDPMKFGKWDLVATPLEQLSFWSTGISIHNPWRDECCPDFSCCQKELQWPAEKRMEFFNNAVQGKSGDNAPAIAASLANLIQNGYDIDAKSVGKRQHEGDFVSGDVQLSVTAPEVVEAEPQYMVSSLKPLKMGCDAVNTALANGVSSIVEGAGVTIVNDSMEIDRNRNPPVGGPREIPGETRITFYGYLSKEFKLITSKHEIMAYFAKNIVEGAGIIRAMSDIIACLRELDSALNHKYASKFDELESLQCTLGELEELCKALTEECSCIRYLNVSKADIDQGVTFEDRRGAIGFVSRDTPDTRRTDQHWVDLSALSRNVVSDIVYDYQRL